MNFQIKKEWHGQALTPQVALDCGKDEKWKPAKQRDYYYTPAYHQYRII
jgi:hypothetical protein